MPLTRYEKSDQTYLQVTGGRLFQSLKEEIPGGEWLEWVNSKGENRRKYGIIYREASGVLKEIKIAEKKFGEDKRVNMAEFIFEDFTFSVQTDSRYFAEFAKKLLNCDLGKEIVFYPYDFIGDEGKRLQGVTLIQGADKIGNYFWKEGVLSSEFPQVEEEKKERPNYWKTYFSEVEWFLVDKLQKLEFPKTSYDTAKTMVEELGEEDFKDDLPF